MKKTLVAMAVLAASGAAMAQSSVTLFGVADAAMSYGRGNAGNLTSLTSGGNATSRLGFRGVEDLGGGLQAGFWLEAGLNLGSGTGQGGDTNNQVSGLTANKAGLTFNRRSTVSVLGNFGEVRLGRDYSATYRSLTEFDPFNDVGVGRSAIDSNGWLAGPFGQRVSNSVAYFLPANVGGVYGEAEYYLGGNSGDVAATSTTTAVGKRDGTGVGLRIGYAQGPINVAASYARTNYTATGNIGTFNVAGAYDLGAAKLFAIYNRDNNKFPTSTKGTGYLLGASAPVGLGEFKATYSNYKRASAVDGSAPRVDKLAVGYVYNLSKRTALYTTVAYLKNKNGAGYGLNGGSTSVNGNSTGLDFGIRHSF